MISVELKLEDEKKLIEKMGNSREGIKKATGVALFRMGNDIRNKAATLAPYKTGNLRRSITTRLKPWSVSIGTNLVYARIHDRGGTIKARTIRPKRAKALRFFMGSKPIFAKSVYQRARKVKPYRGRGYLTPAFKPYRDGKARDILKEELVNFINS